MNNGLPITFAELRVLRLVCAGMCNKQIAAQLGVTNKTIEKHRAALHDKLSVHNAVDLVREAFRLYLVPLNEWLEQRLTLPAPDPALNRIAVRVHAGNREGLPA